MSAFVRSHLTKIAAGTQQDPILSTVHRLTLNGWLGQMHKCPQNCQKLHRISVTNSLLMMIYSWKVNKSSSHHPAETAIMDYLHKSHAGINKALALARMCVYWPGMEADLTATDYIKRCLMCIECSNLPIETLHPQEVPPGPWVKIGMNFFQDHHGEKYLIIADYFSKFPYIFPVASAHHFKTINYLWELFTAEGIPAIVMSDNGSPFNGDEFKRFAWEFDFVHTTSSPHFYQSNGSIEATMKKVKNVYKKTNGSPNVQARVLLQLWDTPISTDLPSPTWNSSWMTTTRNSHFKISQSRSTYIIFGRDSLKYRTHRRNSSTEHTEQRIYECSKWTNKYSSFLTNKGTGPLT